jgi:hypothetical protein
MSTISVFRILTQTFCKKKVTATWVTHQLTEDQNAVHIMIAEELPHHYETIGELFGQLLSQMKHGCEILYQNCSSQSSLWKHSMSSHPKNCQCQQSKVEVMMITAHDKNRVIARGTAVRIHTCATHDETQLGRGCDTAHSSRTL